MEYSESENVKYHFTDKDGEWVSDWNAEEAWWCDPELWK